MSTQAQIKANRQNAQKSTGPQTAEGKAAVSQNAVKHGLFAAEAVITGEDPADYEAFHDQFLAELAPIGMVESMLAERVISLAWRLKRAVRMQNQSIDVMIALAETDSWQIMQREKTVKAQDPRACGLDLLLGWATNNDFSGSRILDRLMLYERRIENSLHKTINRLKQYQVIRQIQLAETRKPSPSVRDEDATRRSPAEKMDDLKKQNQSRPSAGNPKSEYLNPKRVKKDAILKKQSQLLPELIGATSYIKGDYNNNPAGDGEENKAKQSQFHTPAPAEGAGKSEKSVAAATG